MALARHIIAFEDKAEVVATIDVGQMWDRMLDEFLGEFAQADREGIAGAELADRMKGFMDDLSVKPEGELARQGSTVAYNEGRNAELLSARTTRGLRFVVRSEVLDTNTCRPCSLLDSEVFTVGSSEYFANMPPAQCDGGARCRGFYIPVGEV